MQHLQMAREADYDSISFDLINEDADRFRSELHSQHTSLVTGEALRMMKSVRESDGWSAWKKLFHRHNAKRPCEHYCI